MHRARQRHGCCRARARDQPSVQISVIANETGHCSGSSDRLPLVSWRCCWRRRLRHTGARNKQACALGIAGQTVCRWLRHRRTKFGLCCRLTLAPTSAKEKRAHSFELARIAQKLRWQAAGAGLSVSSYWRCFFVCFVRARISLCSLVARTNVDVDEVASLVRRHCRLSRSPERIRARVTLGARVQMRYARTDKQTSHELDTGFRLRVDVSRRHYDKRRRTKAANQCARERQMHRRCCGGDNAQPTWRQSP